MEFSLEVASVRDREDLVVEIWLGKELVAELRLEPAGARTQIYPNPGGRPWDVTYDELVAILHRARAKLDAAPRSEG